MDADSMPLAQASAIHSELSQTIRVVLGSPQDVAVLRGLAPDLVEAVAAGWFRAVLARRFYNEAVLGTQRLRRRRGVRLFHLAGSAPMPQTFEIDDLWPAGLGEAPG
jgi:hypothetical protein